LKNRVSSLPKPKRCPTRIAGPTKQAAQRISIGFHAAQAFIFESKSTGKAARWHGGVQRQFACLVKNDPRFDVELRAFLPHAYNFKAMADYQTGPGSQVSARARGDNRDGTPICPMRR
jgi:hypothetical protein